MTLHFDNPLTPDKYDELVCACPDEIFHMFGLIATIESRDMISFKVLFFRNLNLGVFLLISCDYLGSSRKFRIDHLSFLLISFQQPQVTNWVICDEIFVQIHKIKNVAVVFDDTTRV